MNYAQIINGTVAQEFDQSQLVEWDANNYCTAKALVADGKADQFGVVALLETVQPAFDPATQTVIRDGCELVDGQWQYKWRVDSLTPSQIEAKRKASVPQSITRAQAKAALIINGLIGYVQPSIDAIEDPIERALAQNDWDERLNFERSNQFLTAMAAKLGLTEAQLDALFIAAAQL